MERPSTSKPRGICRYYTTPRGCFAGKNCKFLHGENERLTSYDQNKICRFYRAGYCRRGADCWFRHVDEPRKPEPESRIPSDEDLHCNVCYEKPITYALLSGCSHVFCLQCIRQWRDSFSRNEDVSSETSKSCPYCRVSSRFITPSSQFFPEGHPRKAEIIAQYKASMARVPCRYFQKSPPTSRHCPFGRDCFYQHMNEDGTPYFFEGGAEENMNNRRPYRWSSLEGLEDINATLAALRTTLPSLLGFSEDGVGLANLNAESILNLAEGMLQDFSLQTLYNHDGFDVQEGTTFRPISPQEPLSENLPERDERHEPREIPTVSSPLQLSDHGFTGLEASPDALPITINLSNGTFHSPSRQASSPGLPEAGSGDESIEGVENNGDGCQHNGIDIDDTRITTSSSTDVPPRESGRQDGQEASASTAVIDSETTFGRSVQPCDDLNSRGMPLYHNPNPPFTTDGRGRVVWSNRGSREMQSSHPRRPSLAQKARTDDLEAVALHPSALTSAHSRADGNAGTNGRSNSVVRAHSAPRELSPEVSEMTDEVEIVEDLGNEQSQTETRTSGGLLRSLFDGVFGMLSM